MLVRYTPLDNSKPEIGTLHNTVRYTAITQYPIDWKVGKS